LSKYNYVIDKRADVQILRTQAAFPFMNSFCKFGENCNNIKQYDSKPANV